MNTTATLARSITWAASKQSYYTACLMVDKGMMNDCYRAYAYFRWLDDVIDVSLQTSDERISFIKRQRELVDRLYKNEQPNDLAPEEEIIADLISHDKQENSRLRSYIYNFLAILEFDARRKGRLISQQELTWYANCLGKSVTDGIQYFIGYEHPYPTTSDRYLAATAAHITHMLRDMVQDISEGFVNIPREYLETHGISPEEVNSPPFRAWVQERVELARQYFGEGKHYLDELDVLRCKIAGYWYCLRFEVVLDAIERDGYTLRATYNQRHSLSTWLKFTWLGLSVTLRHIIHQGWHNLWQNQFPPEWVLEHGLVTQTVSGQKELPKSAQTSSKRALFT
jgi:phytoene/squalene synthetase